MLKFSSVLTCLVAFSAVAADSTRTLAIETLTEKARIRTYPAGTDVAFRLRGKEGSPLASDTLQWIVVDWNGKVRLRGKVPFGRAEWEQGVVVTVPGRGLGAGCFQFCPRLASDGATIPAVMSRPAGFEAFGLLPDIDPVPVKSADKSRFGAQGTAWLYDDIGVWPAYDTIGIKWVYGDAKPVHARPTKETVYEPKSEETHVQQKGWDYYGRHGYSVLVNMHGVPRWMLDLPEHISSESANKDTSRIGQSYPLKEEAAYRETIGKLMLNQERLRRISRPHMSRNWYELHWEPDWHWRGTDEEFIAYYRLAREAMDANDPTARLTAANFGVIDVGNPRLSRLFKKGLGRYVNGVTTHTYMVRDGQENGGGWPEATGLDLQVRRLRQMTDHYIGKGAPILQTEDGLHFDVTNSYRAALVEHAERIVRSHLITLGEGCDTTFFFYLSDFDDYSKRPQTSRISYGLFYNEDPTGRLFGPREIAPKPTGMAVAALTRLLEGTRTAGRLDTFGEGVYAYAFRRTDEYLVAAWTTNAAPRRVRFAVGRETLSQYDLMGNRTQVDPDATGMLEVELSTSPIYLLGVGADEVKAARKRTLAHTASLVEGKLDPVTPIAGLSSFSPWLGKEALAYSASKWRGEKDFSVRYRLTADEKAAHLTVEVKDDVQSAPGPAKGLWRNDCVLVAFGCGREEGGEWDRIKTLMIRRGEDGRAEFGALIGAPPQMMQPVCGVVGSVKRDEAVTRYELTVPYAAFGTAARVLSDKAFGFGLSVHDVDSEADVTGDSHRSININGGAPFFMQSMRFGGVGL